MTGDSLTTIGHLAECWTLTPKHLRKISSISNFSEIWIKAIDLLSRKLMTTDQLQFTNTLDHTSRDGAHYRIAGKDFCCCQSKRD